MRSGNNTFSLSVDAFTNNNTHWRFIMLKLAIITSFLSQTKDRFHEYNKPLNLDEKFALLSTIEGYNGVEIVFPYEVNDVNETKAALEKYNLGVSAVNVNVKAEPEFRNGGLTSLEQAVREKAVQFIKDAKDLAGVLVLIRLPAAH
jgi:xylose isomerase